MNHFDYAAKHRNLYLDHPSSKSHNEKYITPIDNQYTILNHRLNPYHVFDNFSLQMMTKRPSVKFPSLKKSVSRGKIEEYEQTKRNKENNVRYLENQISGLREMVESKQRQIQIDFLTRRNQGGNNMPIPIPIFMPSGNSCQCHCQCKCQRTVKKKKVKKYRPVVTEKVEIPESIQEVSESNTQRKPLKKSKPMKLVKKIPKKIKNRFKIWALSIYFMIYLKNFSYRFTINRYNDFKGKYITKNSYRQNNKQIYEKMIEIDVIRIIKLADHKINNLNKNNNKQTEKNISEEFKIEDYLKEENVTLIQKNKVDKDFLISDSKVLLFQKCVEFNMLFLQALENFFTDEDFLLKHGEPLTIGSFTQSFVCDNAFVPHEVYLMEFDEKKGYLRLNLEQEKTLLMSNLFFKLSLFNFLLQLDNNKLWYSVYQDKYEEEDKQLYNNYFIFIELAAKILYLVCQQIYDETLEANGQTNYNNLIDKFRIKTTSPLIYSHKIKKRREYFKQENARNSPWVIFGIEKVEEMNDLIKEDWFKFSKNKIKKTIWSLLDRVRGELKTINRQNYEEIKEKTLAEEYVVFRGIRYEHNIQLDGSFMNYGEIEQMTRAQLTKVDLKTGKNFKTKKGLKTKAIFNQPAETDYDETEKSFKKKNQPSIKNILKKKK